MGLEVMNFISDFVITNPVGASDFISQGDDHIRGIKAAVKATFPNANGAMTMTPTEANLLSGRTVGALAVAGTVMLFRQTSPPTGWTKNTSFDDHSLRVVSGAVNSGGVTNFSSVFGPTLSTAGFALTTSHLPAHSHPINDPAHSHVEQAEQPTGLPQLNPITPTYTNFGSAASTNLKALQVVPDTTGGGRADSGTPVSTLTSTTGVTAGNTGGGVAHAHDLTLNLKFVDVIIAAKD